MLPSDPKLSQEIFSDELSSTLMSKGQEEDWKKNIKVAEEKASEIRKELARVDNEIRDSWGRIKRLTARVHQAEERGEVGDIEELSRELGDLQRIGIQASITLHRAMAYQDEFGQWLSAQAGKEGDEEVQEQIRVIQGIQTRIKENYARTLESLNRQRQEVALLYQGLSNVHVVSLIRLVSNTNAKLTILGVLITVVGVVVGFLAVLY